jgi:predicted dithiol-disulfide oxidoreductase (DUF899 family)
VDAIDAASTVAAIILAICSSTQEAVRVSAVSAVRRHGVTTKKVERAVSRLLPFLSVLEPPASCPVCSSIADTLASQVVHLKARDTPLLLASRAPIEKLLAYRERMGWPIAWVSSGGSDFNRDLGLLSTKTGAETVLGRRDPPVVDQMADATGTDVAGYVWEGPGLSAYALQDQRCSPDPGHHHPRPRAGDGLLRAARPHATRAPSGRRTRALAPPSRRVRGELSIRDTSEA